jgi:multicomponent Na+:H+ antiporter subunit D
MDAAAAIVTLIFAPMLAGLLCWLIGRARVTDTIAVTLAIALVGAVAVLAGAALTDGGLRLAFGGHAVPLGIEVAVDGLTLAMLALTQVVAFAVNVYIIGWARTMAGDVAHLVRVVWMLLWSGLNALFLSADLFNVYVTLEITTLAGVALVAAAGGAGALAAAMRYLQFALAGSILYLLGVALVYGETGTVSMALVSAEAHRTPGGLTALGAMTLGLLLKAALFPLHGWLPPAHSSAPSPASALLSALVVKAAAYLLLRIWIGPFGLTWSYAMAQVVGAIGLAGILYASVQAMRQPRLKLVIAYSTVAQLGYLLLLVPLAGALAWRGIIYQALAHGLAKAAMFLAAGNVIKALGNDRLENLAGLDRVLAGNVLVIALAGVSLAGLPPSAGFLAKWWLLLAAIDSGQWWWAIGIVAGGLLAAAYVFRVLRHNISDLASAVADERTRAYELPATMLWPPYLLSFLAIALGFTGDVLAPYLDIGMPWDARDD